MGGVRLTGPAPLVPPPKTQQGAEAKQGEKNAAVIPFTEKLRLKRCPRLPFDETPTNLEEAHDLATYRLCKAVARLPKVC